MDYYQKYLKYKTKYLELKAQLGGVGGKKTCMKCKTTDPCKDYGGRRIFKDGICQQCKHNETVHIDK